MIAQAALAFVVASTSSDGSEIQRWSSFPVAVDVHESDCTTTSGCPTACETALDTWDDVSSTTISFSVGSWSGSYMSLDESGGSDTDNGFNRIGWSPDSWSPGASSALAITLLQGLSDTPAILEADIYVDEYYFDFDTSGSASEFDVQAIVTHEVGHLLGVRHTSISTATMFYATTAGDTSARSLETDDEDAARFLYPTGGTFACGSNGECPTIVEAFDIDETEIGTMVCTDSECCLGSSCGSGTGGSIGDPCSSDADCGTLLTCPWDGSTCQACDAGEGGTFGDCFGSKQCSSGDCWTFEDEATCGTCLPPCDEQSDCTGDAAHCFDADGDGTLRCIPDLLTDTIACDLTQPSACPLGQSCGIADMDTDELVTICFEQGSGDFGDDCDSPGDCETLLCLGSASDATCSIQCGGTWPDCPAGYDCIDVTASGFEFEACMPGGGGEGEAEAEAEGEAEGESEGEGEGEGSEGESEVESESTADERGCACHLGRGTTAPSSLWLLAVAVAVWLRKRHRSSCRDKEGCSRGARR